ncbi:hypothetical protein [Nocardia iowensis]|uniref:Uncharacterized protein n=1 Tax=Nocardia iowensis TaxID=204891 RepID=A0ABX8RHT8_NOCIO|nr:hypothetical protein [Nocardia iowensis]QXN88557.1 hypothetical protein KV110_23480 [Nocardia iowensis]
MSQKFEELGLKVQRAHHAIGQIRGEATVRGVRVVVDAENRLLAVDVPDADAILEAYEAALRDKQPRVEAAMQELRADARFESVMIFAEANSARKAERAEQQDEIEYEEYFATSNRRGWPLGE